jgi:hypothetical protein
MYTEQLQTRESVEFGTGHLTSNMLHLAAYRTPFLCRRCMCYSSGR